MTATSCGRGDGRSYEQLAHFAGAYFPGHPEGGVRIAVLTAYLDDSFDQHLVDGLSSYVIGGYVSSDAFWRHRFTPAWRHALAHSAPRATSEFKASDCRNQRKSFAGWSKDEATSLTVGVVDAISGLKRDALIGISCAIVFLTKERRLTRKELDSVGFSMAFRFAMTVIMRSVGQVARPDAPLLVVPDRKDGFAGRMTENFDHIAAKLPAEIASSVQLGPAGDSKHIAPLQAADLLAYETFREARHRMRHDPHPPSKALQRLVDSHHHVALCADYGDIQLVNYLEHNKGAALEDRPIAASIFCGIQELFASGSPIRRPGVWPYMFGNFRPDLD